MTDLNVIADKIEPLYKELRVTAEMFNDVQHSRIMFNNRLKSLTVSLHVGDETNGYAAALFDAEHAEESLRKELERSYRQIAPPGLIAWQEASPGVGAHMLARLLGDIGHPRLAIPYYWGDNEDLAEDEYGNAENPKRRIDRGEPFLRTVSQLHQFCGHGAAMQRFKGMTQAEALGLGRPKAKMLVHLIAESVVKQTVRNACATCGHSKTAHGDDGCTGTVDRKTKAPCGCRKPKFEGSIATHPYGQVYLDTKAKYAASTHSQPCSGGNMVVAGRAIRVRCKVLDGRKKRYADVGDPYQAGHVNAIALRMLGKQILADMFEASQEDWSMVGASSPKTARANARAKPIAFAPAPSSDHSCEGCGIALVKKPGPGRWPKRCAACKAA